MAQNQLQFFLLRTFTGNKKDIVYSRSKCADDFEDVVKTSKFCYKFLPVKTNRYSATKRCNFYSSKSTLVTFQTQEELYYVAMTAHIRLEGIVPDGVWTDFERQLGKHTEFLNFIMP